MGAWAPRPAQHATASLLLDQDAIQDYVVPFRATVARRLKRIRNTFLDMKAEGLPVDALESQGTIYLTVRFDVLGRKLPDGRTITTDEDVRRLLLEEAKVAFLPFTAFGVPNDTGWARLSIGAVDDAGIDGALERIRTVLGRID
jgi:aspartate aminotransferase